MKSTAQIIKDPESEGEEIREICHAVGNALRESTARPGKSGLSYLEFKEKFLKTVGKSCELHEKGSE